MRRLSACLGISSVIVGTAMAQEKKTLSFSELVKNQSFESSVVPWTDTYWPFTKGGHTDRWLPDDVETGSYRSFFKFFKRYIKDISTNDFEVILSLSPAEKYDYLMLGDMEKSLEKLGSDVKDLEKASDISLKFTEDKTLDLEAHPIIAEILSQAYDIDYRFENEGLTAIKAAAEIRQLIDDSPQVRRNFPLVAEAWSTWSSFQGDPDVDDWGWQGHCGGWSPAAIHEEAPKFGVLAKKSSKEILFSQGDIRGLLSKSWTAPGAPKLHQVGKNCNTKPKYIPSGHGELSYRPYDGDFLDDNDQAMEAFKILNYFAAAHKSGEEYLAVKFITENHIDQPRFALLAQIGFSSLFPSKIYKFSEKDTIHDNEFLFLSKYFIDFDEKEHLLQWAKENDNVEVATSKIGVEINESCDDLDPKTMMEILITQYKEQGVKLVIDRDASDQKWNQPVSGYSFDFSDLKSVSSLSEDKRNFLNEQTAYISEVSGRIDYVSEPSQHLPITSDAYDRDAITALDLSFILEFDSQEQLISSYWKPTSQASARRFRPDYIGYFQETEPKEVVFLKNDYNHQNTNKNSSVYDLGDLWRIHKCSLDDSLERFETTMEYKSGWSSTTKDKLTYVTCSLD